MENYCLISPPVGPLADTRFHAVYLDKINLLKSTTAYMIQKYVLFKLSTVC